MNEKRTNPDLFEKRRKRRTHLSDTEKAAVRTLIETGRLKKQQAARQFNISAATVTRIVHGDPRKQRAAMIRKPPEIRKLEEVKPAPKKQVVELSVQLRLSSVCNRLAFLRDLIDEQLAELRSIAWKRGAE